MPDCRQRIWRYPTPALLSIATDDTARDTASSLGSGTMHFLNQVHGSALVPFPTEEELGLGPQTNGLGPRSKVQPCVPTGDGWLWSGEPSGFALQGASIAGAADDSSQDFVGLAIRTADCVPALLLDADWGSGALLHLGRKGIEGRLLPKAIQAIRELRKSARPLELQLYLGPSIGPCCYEVPVAMAEEFCHRNAANCSAACMQMRDGRCFLDLRQAIVEQAQQAEGCAVVLEYTCPDCTSCLAAEYIASPETQAPCYSYRRGHKTQRIVSFVRFARCLGSQASG